MTSPIMSVAMPAISDWFPKDNSMIVERINENRQRDCSQSGEMTQTQQRLQLRECTQNSDCTCEEPCVCNQGDSETATGNTYQNQFCEQTCLCSQNRNRLGVEK